MKKQFASIAGIALSTLCVSVASAAQDLYFSEYIEGSSFNKALEIYNDTGANIDLTNYSIEIYFNGNTSPSSTIALSGSVADQDVYVVADDAADPAILAETDLVSTVSFYNGDDTIVLLNDGVIVDVIGQLGVDPGSRFGTPPTATQNQTLRRKSSVTDGDTNPDDAFDPATEWDGFANDSFDNLGRYSDDGGNNGGGNTGACNDPATLISAIQGTGSESLLTGTTVEVEAVVVGDFQGSDGLRGFFLQEEDGDQDGNIATSEGIFVFESSNVDVAIGDVVRVSGNVSEFFGLTQINNVTSVTVCANGASVTAAAPVLPATDSNYLEQFEGMAVEFSQTLTVSENYNLGRFGELVLSSGRLINPTNAVTPGADANAMQAANNLNRILLDDGQTSQNPDPVIHPAPGLSAFNTVRGGDTVDHLSGVMSYSFNEYRIQPTGDVVCTNSNPRPLAPAIEKDDANIRVASFNVLNFFNGDGQGGDFPTPRGADTFSELERQKAKIVSAIINMNADIIGLMEIENDGYGANSAIAELVEALNAAATAGTTYAFVDPGSATLGTDAIAVGIIYRSDRVTQNGTAVTTASGPFADRNRQPIAQSFESNADSRKQLTVAVNHFKSKGSCPGDASINDDQGDGQGCWNAVRTEASNFLADWLATYPTGVEDEDILIIGDINAYAKEDPISAFITKGYTDLIDSLGTESDQYSYVFFGQAGRLDHAVASASLVDQVQAVSTYHISADEPRVLDYNEEFQSPSQVASLYNADMYRASDHDPVLVDIKLAGSLSATMLIFSLLGFYRRFIVK